MTDYKIFIDVDLGSSSTRGLYYADFNGDVYRGFVHQSSGCEPIYSSDFENQKFRCDAKTSMVRFSEREGDAYWRVGEKANNGLIHTDPMTQKSITVVPKVLVFVGEILNRIPCIPPDELSIQLRFLLPIGEHTQFRDLEAKLTKHLLHGYAWNQTQVSFAESNVVVLIEGTGIATVVPKDKVVYILTCGHKDFNLIAVEEGHPLPMPRSKTLTGTGMSDIIHKVCSYPNDVLAAKAVFHYLDARGTKGEAKGKASVAALASHPNDTPMLLAQLNSAFESSWLKLQHALNSDGGLGQAEKVYVTGGNVRLWKERLRGYFGNRYSPLGQFEKEFKESYPEIGNSPWRFRGTDVYLLHLDSIGQRWTSPQTNVVQSVVGRG